MMHLNEIKPAAGSKTKAKRLGRGIGSGKGKTCGRGHKGQRARAGGFHRVGFEGGQTPIQRRLPKFGFYSRMSADVVEVRLGDLAKIEADIIDMTVLHAHRLVRGALVKRVKIIKAGECNKAIKLKGLAVTAGARAAITASGGSIED